MRIRYLLWLLCVLACFSSCILSGDEPEMQEGNELEVGDTVPEFAVWMNDGSLVSPEDFKGKVWLVVFFHTGCQDCREELPVLQRFHETYPLYPVVCISRAETDATIADYWKENGLTLPYSAQTDKTVYHLFAESLIPRIYVVDATGIIRRIFTDNPPATYEQLVEAVQDSE